MADKDHEKLIATNRSASHEFIIHEKIEAGLVLLGSEVKSLRTGKATITDGWAEVTTSATYLHGLSINEYAYAHQFSHEPKRKRTLLLHRAEMKRLANKTSVRGYTLIPLRLYFKNAFVKIELGLVTHKDAHDKRDAKREKDLKREAARDLAEIKRK